MHRNVVAFAALWPILINTIYGVRGTDRFLHDVARTSGVGPGRRLVRVTLPAALPSIATGIRISASLALLVCVTAEFVVGTAAAADRLLHGGAAERRPHPRAVRAPSSRSRCSGTSSTRGCGPPSGGRSSGAAKSGGPAGDGAGRPVDCSASPCSSSRFGAWELWARSAGSFTIPAPSSVLRTAADVWPTGDFLGVVAASLEPARRRLRHRSGHRHRARTADGLVDRRPAPVRAARRARAGHAGHRDRAGGDDRPRPRRCDADQRDRVCRLLPRAGQHHRRCPRDPARGARHGVDAARAGRSSGCSASSFPLRSRRSPPGSGSASRSGWSPW